MRRWCLLFCCLAVFAHAQEGSGGEEAWRAAQIDDALRAAPPTVTRDAKVYAWKGAEMVLVRDGSGPYSCVASGSWSLRLKKPALPHPDPFCADQNAFAYLRAVWSEKDTTDPSRALPRAPGLVWMLAGMNVNHDHGKDESRAKAGTMTPHVMILPLPLEPGSAGLAASYDPKRDLDMWIMGANTPTAHLHVHFTPATHEALKKLK